MRIYLAHSSNCDYINEIYKPIMLIIMLIAIILSGLIICLKKKNTENEQITIDNGYMHMKIVLMLTLVLFGLQNIIL